MKKKFAKPRDSEAAKGIVCDDEYMNEITVCVAEYDFTEAQAVAIGDEVFSFRKGEKLEVLDKSDDDWWFAKSLSTKLKGYIPSSYVKLVMPVLDG